MTILSDIIKLSESLCRSLPQNFHFQPIPVFKEIERNEFFIQLMKKLKEEKSENLVKFTTEKFKESFDGDHLAHISLVKRPDLNIGIFLFPQGTGMPLHDHPEMLVITKVLMGTLDYLSVGLKDDHIQRELPLNFFDSFKDGFTVQKQLNYERKLRTFSAEVNELRELKAGDTLYLTPERGNLHSFEAVKEPAAILDIILPDYDYERRFCNFYKILSKLQSKGIIELKYNSPLPPYECRTLGQDNIKFQ